MIHFQLQSMAGLRNRILQKWNLRVIGTVGKGLLRAFIGDFRGGPWSLVILVPGGNLGKSWQPRSGAVIEPMLLVEAVGEAAALLDSGLQSEGSPPI